MAIGDLTRINTNIAAFNALNSLRTIGNQLSTAQLRLQTGKRINEAADDPAGFSIVSKLTSRARGLATALDSVGTSTNLLSIAEGSAQSIHDNLLNIQDLIRQATSDNLGTSERNAIEQQIDDLSAEITRLRDATTFNGVKLLDGTFTGKRILTGSESTETILASISQDFSLASLGITDASIAVDTATNASLSLTYVDAALTSVRLEIQNVGALGSRLRATQDNLAVAITNTRAAASRVQDADVAAEQVNAVRLQILQQLATAQLAQANSGPQQVLALFR
ncbi:MAG TPA: flagellin [Verrucomicrobiae bacterium]|nr:flagellin [Verrucomicrobiae bacterium]